MKPPRKTPNLPDLPPRPLPSRNLLRALGRTIFALLLLGSSVVWIGSAILWVRSYFVSDYWEYLPENRGTPPLKNYFFRSGRGGIGAFFREDSQQPAAQLAPQWRHMTDDPQYPSVPQPADGWFGQFAGFAAWDRQRVQTERIVTSQQIVRLWHRQRDRALIVPWWSLLVIATPIPLFTIRTWRRRRRAKWRRAHGQCEFCGQELGAKPPEQCPKCGRSTGNPKS